MGDKKMNASITFEKWEDMQVTHITCINQITVSFKLFLKYFTRLCMDSVARM